MHLVIRYSMNAFLLLAVGFVLVACRPVLALTKNISIGITCTSNPLRQYCVPLSEIYTLTNLSAGILQEFGPTLQGEFDLRYYLDFASNQGIDWTPIELSLNASVLAGGSRLTVGFYGSEQTPPVVIGQQFLSAVVHPANHSATLQIGHIYFMGTEFFASSTRCQVQTAEFLSFGGWGEVLVEACSFENIMSNHLMNWLDQSVNNISLLSNTIRNAPLPLLPVARWVQIDSNRLILPTRPLVVASQMANSTEVLLRHNPIVYENPNAQWIEIRNNLVVGAETTCWLGAHWDWSFFHADVNLTSVIYLLGIHPTGTVFVRDNQFLQSLPSVLYYGMDAIFRNNTFSSQVRPALTLLGYNNTLRNNADVSVLAGVQEIIVPYLSIPNVFIRNTQIFPNVPILVEPGVVISGAQYTIVNGETSLSCPRIIATRELASLQAVTVAYETAHCRDHRQELVLPTFILAVTLLSICIVTWLGISIFRTFASGLFRFRQLDAKKRL